MSLADQLRGATRVFLDTAPVIYYVESNHDYLAMLEPIFDRVEDESLVAVTSPITLAECLVVPARTASNWGHQEFEQLIVRGRGVEFATIDAAIAIKAAEIRAKHGLHLLDAAQVACAILKQCDAIVTNDRMFLRVTEIPVLTLV